MIRKGKLRYMEYKDVNSRMKFCKMMETVSIRLRNM